MLEHKAIGPYEDGSYLVVYPTPGCSSILTVACDCRNEAQAAGEVDRLNKAQIQRDDEIRRNRELRGFRIYMDMESGHS